MGFFWKFTRSGCISGSYVSLIFDVDPDSVDRRRGVWKTSFEELGHAMILLHDVEILNQPTLGTTKGKFKKVVEAIGYEPTLAYRQLRNELGLVVGQATMGRHDGTPLDWGRCELIQTPIDLSIGGLEKACFIPAEDGRRPACEGWSGDKEDKLSCYRAHPSFVAQGEFFDLMPKHEVMKPIIAAMKQCDGPRTENFICNFLKWQHC